MSSESTQSSEQGAEKQPEYKIITNKNYEFGVPPWGEDFWTTGTALDSFLINSERTPERPFLGRHRSVGAVAASASEAGSEEFVYESYGEVRAHVREVALGLQERFVLKPGDHVAVLSPECAEYVIVALALAALRCVIVPVNENSRDATIEFILGNSDSVAAIISPLNRYCRRNPQSKKEDNNDTTTAVTTDTGGAAATAAAVAQVELFTRVLGADRVAMFNAARRSALHADALPTLEDLRAQGHTIAASIDAASEGSESVKDVFRDVPKMEDLYVIMYTSGTTGMPKGVMLTHGNIVHGASSIVSNVPPAQRGEREWSLFNVLPLSHIYGLLMCLILAIVGGRVAFFSGDRTRVVDEIRAARPAILAAVPRVYQLIAEGIQRGVWGRGVLAGALFGAAYWWKKTLCHPSAYSYVADPVLAQVRAQFGGNLKLVICGGSPIPPDVAEFMRVCFQNMFYDGYGMTETTATGLCTQAGEPLAVRGLVAPFYNYEVKIESVPGLDYRVSDKPHPRGELCLRGAPVFRGYYKDPEATAKVLDKDGFVHTNDIVVEELPGKVRVIDRICNMFKLCQGEYISAEAVEAALCSSPAIACAYIHGDPSQSYPVAIIVPDAAALGEWARQNGLADIAENVAALCRNDRAHEFIASEVLRVSKAEGLKGYETVHKFFLHPYPFDEARDLVTSALKLKRHVLRKYFEKELNDLVGKK